MDLLETILRTAHAVSYLEVFRKSSVDCSTLATLSDHDLEIIGVDDPEVRKCIIERTSNLIIPQEKKVNFVFDEKYIDNVLTQVSRNLQLHHACLSCAIARKDVILCNVSLQNATETLINCLSSFENQVELLEKKLTTRNTNKQWKKFRNYAGGFVLLGTSTLTLFLIQKFVLK